MQHDKPVLQKRQDPTPIRGIGALRLVPLLIIAACSIVVLAIAGNTFFRTPEMRLEKSVMKFLELPGDSISRDAKILAKRIYQGWTDDLILDDLSLQELSREIDFVLTQIRNRYPAMTEISARQRYRPSALLLKLKGNLLDAVVDRWKNRSIGVLPRTGHATFDDLNADLDLHTAKVFPSLATAIMYFHERANLRAAREAYAATDGVLRASFDESLGDGPDIVAANLGGAWYVVMRNAWGGCPSGCTESETFYFIVRRGQVERLEEEKAKGTAQFWVIIPTMERQNWFP